MNWKVFGVIVVGAFLNSTFFAGQLLPYLLGFATASLTTIVGREDY